MTALLLTHAAEAHGGDLPVPENWWSAWNFEPLLLLSLAVAGGVYGHGLLRLWQRAGVGRGIGERQAFAFQMGLFALFVALISPLDRLSAALSSAHMVQHMVLMMLAAPLLVLGKPVLALLWALPPRFRQHWGRWGHRVEAWPGRGYLLWQPLLLWSLYAATLWVWHLPALYQAALRNPYVHHVQRVGFLLAACLFWRVLFDPIGRLRLSRGAGVLYLFTTSLHATVLGVFMALSPRVWYLDYAATTPAWNLTPLEDQQLAGLIMWMPACTVYVVAAAAIFAIWLRDAGGEPEEGAA